MNLDWKTWGYRLGGSVIKGVAGAVLAFFGVAGINAMGFVSIAALDLKQLAFIAVSGAVVGLCSHLNISPLP